MEYLPKNWVETSIGELFVLRQGIQVPKPDQYLEKEKGMIQFLRIVDFTKKNEPPRYISDPGEAYQMDIDDVALVRYGTVGFVCFGKSGVIANNLFRVIPKLDLDKSFLVYYLKSNAFQNSLVSKGATMQALSFKTVNPIVFPLPPLAEQQRIVAKLDTLFAHLDKLKARLEQIPQLMKDFRQSVLTKAVTGKLTEDWREGNFNKKIPDTNHDPEFPWPALTSHELCAHITKGTTPKNNGFTNSGIPFLKVYNIVENKINFNYRPQFVDLETHNTFLKRSRVYPSDVLMNIVGPPLGKVAIVPDDFPEWNVNQAIAIFRPKEKITNKFLYLVLTEEGCLWDILLETKGVVGQSNLSLEQCRSLRIPLPSLEEQTEIVTRVESLFAKADKIEKQYQLLKEKIDTLPQAILAKAFKGELVEQLPTDGSAEGLLKEIKQAKAALNTNKPKAKKYKQGGGDIRMVAEG